MTAHVKLLIVGIILTAIGIILFLWRMVQRKNNTGKTAAALVDYSEEISMQPDCSMVLMYYPVMRYRVSGEVYEAKSSVGMSRKKYMLGDNIGIYYNPKNPTEFIIAGDRAVMISAFIYAATGIICCASALFLK